MPLEAARIGAFEAQIAFRAEFASQYSLALDTAFRIAGQMGRFDASKEDASYFRMTRAVLGSA